MSEQIGQEVAKPELPGWRLGEWVQRILVGAHPRRTLIRVAILAALSFFVFKWVIFPMRIEGVSMEPTFESGSVHFLNHWAYLRHPPRRGDVVGIEFTGMHVMLLKRIIGLPGERISIENGVVKINGRPLAEPYVKFPRAPWNRSSVLLGPNEYYVIGDNREMDQRAHTFGEVAQRRIAGKVLF